VKQRHNKASTRNTKRIDGASNKKQTENNERTYVPEQLVAELLEAQLLTFVPQAIVASEG